MHQKPTDPKAGITPDQVTAVVVGEGGETLVNRVNRAMEQDPGLAVLHQSHSRLVQDVRRFFKNESTLTLTTIQRRKILLGPEGAGKGSWLSGGRQSQGRRNLLLWGGVGVAAGALVLALVLGGPQGRLADQATLLMAPGPPAGEVLPPAGSTGTATLTENNTGEAEPKAAVSQRRHRHVILLVDASASMQQAGKLPLLRRSLGRALRGSQDQVAVSVVAYAGADGVIVEGAAAQQTESVLGAFDMLSLGGPTSGQTGLELAFAVAQRNASQFRHSEVILITDGDLEVSGQPGQLPTLLARMMKSGVSFSAFGFGASAAVASEMAAWSQQGGGQFQSIVNEQDIRRALSAHFGTSQ